MAAVYEPADVISTPCSSTLEAVAKKILLVLVLVLVLFFLLLILLVLVLAMVSPWQERLLSRPGTSRSTSTITSIENEQDQAPVAAGTRAADMRRLLSPAGDVRMSRP